MSDYPIPDRTKTATTPVNTSAPLVGIYWLIVLIPLGWGVFQTVQKSIPLFHVTSTNAGSPAASTTPILTGTPEIAPVAVSAADVTATPVVTGKPTLESASSTPTNSSSPNP